MKLFNVVIIPESKYRTLLNILSRTYKKLQRTEAELTITRIVIEHVKDVADERLKRITELENKLLKAECQERK